jgi:hypothetical protein
MGCVCDVYIVTRTTYLDLILLADIVPWNVLIYIKTLQNFGNL